jgi:hypothetical protein
MDIILSLVYHLLFLRYYNTTDNEMQAVSAMYHCSLPRSSELLAHWLVNLLHFQISDEMQTFHQ